MGVSQRKSERAVRVALSVCVAVAISLIPQAKPVQAVDTTIDGFDSQQSVMVYPEEDPDLYPDPNYRYRVDAGVLGGERDVYVNRDNSTTGDSISVTSNATFSHYSHGQNPSMKGYSTITYDGIDNNALSLDPTGLGGMNISQADHFTVRVKECDLEGGYLRLTVYTDGSNYRQVSKEIPVTGAPGQDLDFSFSEFSTGLGQGTVDFADIGAIVLMVDGTELASFDVILDWFDFNGPTAVDISSFEVEPIGHDIRLAWETGSETNLQGFNLHRSASAAGPYTQLNPTVIPAQNHGQPIGAAYSWLDEDVVPGGTYYYKLEGLEDGGSTTFFGPVSARAVHTVYLPLLVRQ